MLSQNMVALGKKSSVIREIFEYGRKRKTEIGEENVFDFSLGNPSISAPEQVNGIMMDLLGNCDPVLLHGYTSAAGDFEVRSAIAEDISERFGFSADPNLIYMTCGAAASLTITLNAIVNSGDEIIVLAPFFPEYRVFVEKAGASLKTVECPAPNFLPDVDLIAQAINERTKAIIINSPNNPTGKVIPKELLEELCGMLEQKQKEFGNGIYIISDEPYRELNYGCEVTYIPKIYKNTVVCYSYSKSLSLPGERIGYISVSPESNDAKELFAAICGAGRALGFVCAPSLLQKTVARCCGITSNIEIYRKNRDFFYKSLKDIGYELTYPDGAFYLFLKSPLENAVEFCERAKKYEILLVPSDSFGTEGYVRISYCVNFEMIERSIPAFKRLYEECKKWIS